MSETVERERRWHFALAALLVLAAVVLLSAYSLRAGSDAVVELTQARSADVALLTRSLVEREFQHWISALRSVVESSDFLEAAQARDEAEVRAHLTSFVRAHPNVGRAFVTTPAGLLWSDYPPAPESLGQTFAHRDWFEGVSRHGEPYVSRVYRRHAHPRVLLVAVAVPVRVEAGQPPLGIAVCQVQLERLTFLLRQITLGRDGFAFLLDQSGTLAAHPHLDLQAREYEEYARSAPLQAARSGLAREVEYADPFSGEPMLATSVACDVPGGRWTVVVQRPASEANQPLAALALQTGVAALLALGVVGGVLWVQGRVQRRIADLNAQLRAENGQRQAAEAALLAVNERLEALVEERTQELQRTQDQLLHAQKMEAIGRLAGGIAHDFNNLLTVILGFSDLALSRLEAGHPMREPIQQVKLAGERAGGLTRQLLAFSRKQVLQPAPLDLGAAVEHMDAMLRRLLGEDIELLVCTQPALPRVMADPGQVEQIVMNLAVNARDAMPQGGKLTIETRAEELDAAAARGLPDLRPGPHVLLSVTDTGQGMDASTRARIFEPFFTTKPPGLGTGLGLSTVYGIVRQSGGSITVRSEPGQGATFEVRLPCAKEPAPSEAPAAREPERSSSTGTILAVEDEPLIRQLLQRVLSEAGYQVLFAASAEEARQVYAAHAAPVDLLLTDVVLPGEDGCALASHLQARQPGLRVVYMSGYTDGASVHQGLLAPGTAFLEKPLTAGKLLTKLEAVLRGSTGDRPGGRA